MSRPLRIECPGAVYHVASRGNGREDVYVDDGIERNSWRYSAMYADGTIGSVMPIV